MTCRQFIDFLSDYLEGDLPDEQAVAFEEHVKCCPPCGDYLITFEQTIVLARGCFCEGGDDLPDDVPEDLVRAILEARKTSRDG